MATDEELNYIYNRTDGCCHICGKKLSFKNYAAFGARGAWEIEHSLPQARGGTSHRNNLYAACISCNRRKRHGSTRGARAEHGRNAAPLSAAKKDALRRQNAWESGIAVGALALLFGAAAPAVAFAAGLGA